MKPLQNLTPVSRLEAMARDAGFSPVPGTFTPAEVGKVLHLSPPTVRRMMREGKLGFQRVSPRRALVMQADVEAYLSSQTSQPRAA